MHRHRANVARPSITRRRPHSKCICWLDVEIPTKTNLTMMHRRWAKVAWPTITRRRAHSKCIRWLDVIDIPTATYPTMPRCWANMLPGRPSPDIAHTKNAYICPTLARRRHPSATNLTMCPRLANTAWPTITQRRALSDLNAYAGPTLARRRHSNCDPSDHAPTLGQCRPVNHYPTSRTIEMHMLPQRWLDVDIPTMSNPTILGNNYNKVVADWSANDVKSKPHTFWSCKINTK